MSENTHEAPMDAPTCSAFMVLAVHAYHRSSDDSFARLAEALRVCKAESFPQASHRLRLKRDPEKLWGWALKRWGNKSWPNLEYIIRESQPNV